MRQQASHESKWATYRITVIAALGGLLFGYDTGVIAGSQLYFTEYFDLTPSEQGFAVGSALYGSLLGALAAGYLTKRFGRKHTLILSAVLFLVSAWGSGAATSLAALINYRVIGGIGIGLASMAAPMYIAEIAPAKSRGRMVSLYQLAVVVGFFVVFLATYFIGGGDAAKLSAPALENLHAYNVERGWRIMFWSELLPAALFFSLLFLVPHSPRWLMLKSRVDDARRVLQSITDNDAEAAGELREIEESLASKSAGGVGALFVRSIGFALFLGVMLSVFQQITGINAILYYGAEIFSNALGYGPEDALKQQLWLAAVNLIFTFVAIYTVDSWGRKPLFIWGSFGMFTGLCVLGATLYTQNVGVISLVAILVFIGSFAMSMGPVVWVMLSEMFPNHIRSLALSIAVAAQWLFNGIVATSYPLVNDSSLNRIVFSGALPYFIFAFFCVSAILFMWKLVPETKGKSLEQMEALWERKT